MDEFRFFTYSLPGSDDRFIEKLNSVSDSINKQKVINPPWVAALGQSPVRQIAVASSHVAILLEDGRICRIAYSLNVEHLESNKNDSKNLWSTKKPKKKSARLIGGITGAERVTYRRNVTSATIGSSSNTGTSGGGSGAPSRPGRPNYRNLFMSNVPIMAPSQVPEDLIVQVQNVLQGKSRSLIIRELQRTHLDVNSAVNNLLSRDDDDGDDDEVGDLFADDLMSFVENNLSERAGNYILESDQMLVEDYLNYATAYRSSSSSASAGRQRLSLRNEILRSTGITSNSGSGSHGASGVGGERASGNAPSGNALTQDNSGADSNTSSRDDFGRRWLEARLRDPFTAHLTSTTVSAAGANSGAANSASAAGVTGGATDASAQPWELSGISGRGKTVTIGAGEYAGSTDAITWEEPEWFILLPDAVSSPPPKFVQIAAMHSELVALCKKGQVYQWKWNVSMPFVHPDIADVHHPRIAHLELQNEVILSLAASSLRCSVLTQSERVATWMDPVVASYCSKLEHGAIPVYDTASFAQQPFTTSFNGAGELIKELKVCDLFTVAVASSGKLFWWGVAPFAQRRKLLEKQAASKNGRYSSLNDALTRDSHLQSQVPITEGCMVTKKKSPMYHAGAIGFCDATYPPKVGQLMEDIWNLDANCRFKILPLEKKRDDCKKTEMLPPPSPVSVGSEGSHKSTSRKRRRSVSPHPFAQMEEEIEEFWNPKNVVFLEDSQNIPIGTVLKVDGNMALVKFPSDKQPVAAVTVCSMNSENSNHSTTEDQNSLLKDCRLFHKSDLQALKSNSMPKFMDCVQCHPKNIFSNAPSMEKFNILSVAVDCKGVHVVTSASQFKFYYCIIEPSSGFVEERRSFFTDLPAFIGLKTPINLQTGPEDPGRLMMDGNGCLYPLCKDDAGQMREPATLNMLPVKTAAMGTHHVREGTPSVNRVLLTAFVTKSSPTMSAVLQCNQNSVEMRLAEYEQNPEKEGPVIVAERCDGNRNIIHALVSIGRPTANTNQQSSSNSGNTKHKDDSSSTSNRQSGNQSSSDHNTNSSGPVTSAASAILQTPIDADRVISHFEQQSAAATTAAQSGTTTSASLTAATNALQNGAEILRRLREEMNAATEAARRQLSMPAGAFDAIPTIAWPPDPPAYENIPLSTGSLIDIPISAPTSRTNIGPILNSAITSLSNTHTTSSSIGNTTTVTTNLTSRAVASQKDSSATPSTDEERQKAALKILITLLTFSRGNFEKRLVELLSLQDGRGMTPLMLAINLRAYNMAMLIFNAAKRLATNKLTKKLDEEVLMSMVFPPACAGKSRQVSSISSRSQLLRRDDPDYSPLYMLCGNDNCSFTWTGNLHINQDIFECRTCGLHDTYCCCTECAKTCHKGHDCKLKKIWPTAYCDCWRRGRCCALIEGDQKARFDLLVELLQHTNLAAVPNRKGEHLLLCLVNTISRQMLEQSGLSKSSVSLGVSGSNGSKSNRNNPVETENLDGMPDHNLEPPKFCRMALCQTVVNWKAVSSLMLQNANSPAVVSDDTTSSATGPGLYDDLSPMQSSYLKSQTGSAKLDAFTYKLIVKCKNETGFVTLEKLCETLLAQLKKANGNPETLLVVRRFVRSVCRVFVVLSMETQNSKNKVISSEPLRKCKTVFRMLMGVAIEELIETADCLLAPVRMGISRPTRPFMSLSTTDEKQGSAELFSIEPLPARRHVTAEESAAAAAAANTGGASGSGGGVSSRVQSRNLNVTVERSASRDRSDETRHPGRPFGDLTGSNRNPEENIPGLGMHQQDPRDSFGGRVGTHSGPGEGDISFSDGNEGVVFGSSSGGPGGVVNSGGGVGGGLSRGGVLQLDDFNDEHDLGDNDDLDDDGHGSSADGGVGEDDVTFEVDMMEEESDGVDNSEEEEEEEEDDDDLDVPSGGEEQHHLVHVDHTSATHNPNQGPINRSAGVNASNPTTLDAMASPPHNLHGIADITEPMSPDGGRQSRVDGGGAELYFSSGGIGANNGPPGTRERPIIGGASDGGVMSDGEESRSSSQDDESEVGADQGHRGENEIMDDLYLTESTLDAAVADNMASSHANSNQHQTSRNVPVAIQWAVGGQPVAVPAPPTRGMIYVDPSTIRRGGVSNAAAVAAGAGGSLAAAAVNLGAGVPGSSLSSSAAAENTCSSTATNVSLSRAFSLIMRSVTELVFLASEEETDGGYMTQQQFDALQEYVDKRLYITWEWLSCVLDSAEAQLRFGSALINSTDTTHPMHPLNLNQRRGTNSTNGPNSNSNSSSESNSISNSRRAFEGGVSRSSRAAQQDSSAARKDFLNYILSLMRSHSNEHADSLPVIDISAFKHIAYVLDAMIYYLKNGKEAVIKSQDVNLVGPNGETNSVNEETEDYDQEDDSLDEAIFVGLTTGSSSIDDFTPSEAVPSKKGFSFFRRSPSTLCLGATSPDPFNLTYAEALPLAERPQLLTPHASKEEMFGPARFDEAFTLDRNQTEGSNDTITIKRNEVEIVPLQMGMDDRIESSWEGLAGTGEGDGNDSATENMDSQDASIGRTGAMSPEYLLFSANSAGGAGRTSNTNSDTESAEVGENEDDLETGALDMSSSTLNAAEAAERQVHGDESVPPKAAGRNSVIDSSTWMDDNVAGSSSSGPGSSTPNRDSQITGPHPIQDAIEEVTTSVAENVTDFTYTLRKLPRVPKVVETNFNRDVLLGRWSHSLELFGRVFIDDVGAQPGSLLAEISSFDVREARFKKEMERIRNSQTRDLALDVERDRSQLILQTMRQLNSQYSKRSSYPGQPLAVHKVKVTFKNEPGEGTGVSRSFYTAIAEVLLTNERLPKLDSLSAANNSTPMSRIRKVRTSNLPSSTNFSSQMSSLERRSAAAALILGSSNALSNNASAAGSQRSAQGIGSQSTAGATNAATVASTGHSSSTSALSGGGGGTANLTLNVNAPPYVPTQRELDENSLKATIYGVVLALQPTHGSKITGMLVELDRSVLTQLKNDLELLQEKVDEAVGLIMSCSGLNSSVNPTSKSAADVLGGAAAPDDDESAPLFYQPGKTGFYSPRLGKCTKERLDVFRNVGRLIGLCLLQNELIPLPLNRHVLKYILHKELSWHDFAFFDPVTYESMRKLVLDAMDPAAAEMFKELSLSYSVVLCREEGGGEVELVPNGAKYDVTPKNVFDFVRRYCEYRMRQCMEKPLRMIRRGVYEVVPPSALSDLTAEDLRLLLNGTSTIDPKQLSTFTNFIDETGGDDPEKIKKFKRSFWTVVEKMSQKELQDLMYFWTGSPSVPASEEGFQPMPSITLRPADDNYFPSANTCISRLYIPLYSSKSQLKLKLLQAIQVKSFGFV